ncbi:HAD family hydrolase [Chitinimonas taiwanensis]|uniref:Haloacid dehalogenase superfamily, subfamily IA, variant 3 with third motif having DD or ED n=1 Tax=Chitinimonas taiwanensis DSM 18899 TaxID=1121279 RepID=A0A1K2H6G5_9NEIS|nr:HAD family phosphatase [Chitinimonas taiwanensis]SFZ71893.1 haloacid dehalogenase superfamily, subfamily IA, variant 3 with third motif having DD or ED [Chitinimonas taiwanensis DSM 18899]
MQLDFTPAAVLFDMDGLMLDSESAVMQCWIEAAAAHGKTLDEELLHAMVGLHEKLCFALLCQRMPEEEVWTLARATDALYHERVEAGLPLKPGIRSLLEWLDELGIPKAVATSTRRDRAEHKLTQSGLIKHFPVVITGSDIEHPKPAPDIYLLAAKTLQVDPQHCLVLEDSEPGVRAALAAGMTPIQVPDMKAPSAEVRALGHRIVGSLSEAQQLLRPILAPWS